MKLDSSYVEVGDSVYDLIMGWGEVKSVGADHCEVRYGVSVLVYRNNGSTAHFRHKRTLYWNDPVLVLPPKSTMRWGLMRDACKTLCNMILNYKGEDL